MSASDADSYNRFDIVPTPDQLAALNRTFGFVSSEPENAVTLSHEQVDAFNEQGFLAPLDVFSDEEINKHRSYFDRLLEQILSEGLDAYSISSAHLKYGPVFDLLCEPRIVRPVVDLLGPNVIGWGSHYFCKLPGDKKPVDWHQDASYWPLSHTKTVTVWLAIDDADLENGCMQFLAGSHRDGHAEHIQDATTSGGVLGRGITEVERYGTPIANPLRAGQMSIHSDLLIHGSSPNDSDRRRCGLTLRYCSADVTAGLGWNAKGVVVHGQDGAGHWANPSRPK